MRKARLGEHSIEREVERIRTLLGDYRLFVAISAFLNLPGLRGFWPMSSFNESGNAYDLSGQGRILTYNGNPTYNFAGLAPYLDLDGTGDYLSRADEAGLDILGTETYVASAARGLTMGGWFYISRTTNLEQLIGKWLAAGNQKSYRIINNSGTFLGQVSTDGSTNYNVTGGALSTGWWYLVERFYPSTSLDVFQNGTKYSNTAATPASVFNGTGVLSIAASSGGGDLFQGRAALCFLCAAALSDEIIGALYQGSRVLFGV